MAETRRWEYEGRVWVRPAGRGVVLVDLPEAPHLDDALIDAFAGEVTYGSGGRLRDRIVAEREGAEGE